MSMKPLRSGWLGSSGATPQLSLMEAHSVRPQPSTILPATRSRKGRLRASVSQSLRCVVATTAFLLLGFAPLLADDVVCTEDNCHQLDGTVTVSPEHTNALLAAIETLGSPLAQDIRHQLESASCRVEDVLDRFCLIEVSINPESRVKVDPGAAVLRLQKGVWKTFLVKVQNLAGVTAPLLAHSEQAIGRAAAEDGVAGRDRWLQIEMASTGSLSNVLSGMPLEYRIIRLRTESIGKRTAILAMDVGQGTADIGFRNDVMLTFNCQEAANCQEAGQNVPAEHQPRGHATPAAPRGGVAARPPKSDEELSRWLKNMIWHHRFSRAEITAATGLTKTQIEDAIRRFGMGENSPQKRRPRGEAQALTVLPYPGGRHPRIGFLEGAIQPQRETKVSVFTPWDPSSYVVVDVPEAIWSNLGLTYLAHTHIPTIWDEQNVTLPKLEWQENADGALACDRTLPNGISFATKVFPDVNAVHMDMRLTNGTDQKLTDLRVQNCVMLKGAKGFALQSNENKVFWGPYAACRNSEGNRWIITAWDPLDRVWGNAPCPCLHSDPKFPDCEPGETERLQGWLSFYAGTNIYEELMRIERSGWRKTTEDPNQTSFWGGILDCATGQPLPARVHLQGEDGSWHLVDSDGGSAVHYEQVKPQMPLSPEVHTTLSADPFVTHLPPGEYTVRIERGKEYFPLIEQISLVTEPVSREFRLSRWINMAERDWYSGDTHVHRSSAELPNAMLAEDLNVTLPLSYWVTVAATPPVDPKGEGEAVEQGLIEIDPTHVIYPINTEYEIFMVAEQRHTLGAVFVLNHKSALPIGAPPVAPIGELGRKQGAVLDLDKHSWPWSLMIAPVMKVDLFELSNNHVWQTPFGFKQWTLDSSAEYMDLERDEDGFTEWGWIDYGFKAFYALVNCGFRMRVSAGTASGVHPVQVGFGRVYVHLPNGFSYDEWIAGLDAGRSFVSNGPMLDLRFNGRDAGHVFEAKSETEAMIHVTGTCESRRPLERIEIVVNGEIQKIVTPQNIERDAGGYMTRIDATIRRDASFWVAVRCFEDHPANRVRFAHTNPVYLDVEGKPVRPRKCEVNHLIRRMEEELSSVRDVVSKDALAEYQEALDIYREIAKTAR